MGFLDLGSGLGNSLLYFYELFPGTSSITGIEYLEERHASAVAKVRAQFDDAPEPCSAHEYHHGPFHLYCGNFLEDRFREIIKQATLIYVANLAFTDPTNERVHDMLCQSIGAVVVSCKPFSSIGSTETVLN